MEGGVTLEVTTLIQQNGELVLGLKQTIEQFSGSVTIEGVGEVPTTTRTEMEARILVHDLDTIVLSGLIEKDKSKLVNGARLLRPIGLPSHLFPGPSEIQG